MTHVERSLTIGSTRIADDTDAYVLAEIGHNHQGNLSKAKELIRAAADSGANAVKLQKRDNRVLFTQAAYDAPYASENAFGRTYGEHREFLEFERWQYEELQAYAKQQGVDFFATAFDEPSLTMLVDLGAPAIKLASGDITNIQLISAAAKTKLPLIISTGTASMQDVQRAFFWLRVARDDDFRTAFLQCTAAYPCPAELLNLRVIESYREAFPGCVVGLSTHYNGPSAPAWAYMLGARVIEMHLTLDRTLKGTDHAFSLEPKGFAQMVRDVRRARLALGSPIKRTLPVEEPARAKMGKSLYLAHAVSAGHVLTAADIAIKSPGGGTPPYEFSYYIGATAKQDLPAETALEAHLFAGVLRA